MTVNPEENKPTVDEAFNYLTPDTINTLSGLLDAPRSIAKAALALVPYGSRAAMQELGIVKQENDIYDLTPLGVDVMLAARQREDER